MAKKTAYSKKKQSIVKQYSFHYKSRRFRVFVDKILFFRILRKLHGRFWGVAGSIGLSLGMGICFLIKPEMLTISTAFSDFGMDVRTAPYFSGAVFFAAYGLWRWRAYLKRTLKRSRPILGLIGLTILGLYMVALMPISWQPWPYRLHMIGMAITAISAGATVIFDILLSKTPWGRNADAIRIMKMATFLLIVIGGWLTLGSTQWLGWFAVSLPGEVTLMGGYFAWIFMKTYLGEDPRSGLSRLLKKIILID